MPWLPTWLDLEIIVPVGATIVVLCVGVLVICVALTRRKQPQMTPGGKSQIWNIIHEYDNEI